MFGGASLALMGTSLAAGARRHAADNLAWRREWRQAVGARESAAAEGRGLMAAYRAAGALLFLIGLSVALAGLAGRVAVSPLLGARILGACCLALGLGFGALKLSSGAASGPRLPEKEPVAALSAWALCALWAAFGLRLLAWPSK